MLRVIYMIFAVAGFVPWTLAQDQSAPVESTAETGDGVDELVATLSANELWKNGLSPNLDLPEAASIEQVVARVFGMIGFQTGRVTEYRILKTRQVRIPGSLPDVYSAVVVDTNLGKKIVLLQYHRRWWSRVYDSQPSA